jgi:RNA polymerase sigma-70 factor (ECF subfamily)
LVNKREGIAMQREYALQGKATRHATTVVAGMRDEDLIESIARGDKGAMRVLYARHSVPIYRFILRLRENTALSEDLVSEVFLYVWRQAEAFEAKSKVSTWLLAIARYKAFSALRRRSDEQLDDVTAAVIEDPADDPEIAFQGRQRSALIGRCLMKLSPAHRQVIDLVYYHEKSIGEVARIVGIPASTVKTRMFYARARVAKLLAEAGVERVCS